MRIATLCVVALTTVQHVVAEEPKNELAPPVHVLVDGKPLDTRGLGYAAPFVGDFDGDSIQDLMIGEMQYGQMRIHRNVGTNQQPQFASSFWFQVVVDDVTESGRVPAG